MANYLKTVVAPQVPPELYDSFIAAIDKGHKNNAKQKHASRSPSDSRCSINGRCIQHVPSFDWWRDDSSFIRYSCATEPSQTSHLNLNDAPSLCRYLESFYTLRKGLKDNSSRALIGVKRMGELDSKPFQESCKRKYSADEADEKALVLCSQWEEYLKDPDWHPFKIIQVKEDVHQVCLLTLL
ncbi:hypothetical protein IFM89_037599 [Coptis chinensis]|uniref:Factor of DNA methylation 1-5/IDN2 domain-containing protein n=1 Tax=Coptis chinensis TaxID=261450 RepID=A0A835HA14_9MAGN|nr:hypothetical protein IFM89_037599 [Coptis chinensis]